MRVLDGATYTPLDENDKIRDLAVVWLRANSSSADGGPIELCLGVSSPFSTRDREEIDQRDVQTR